nr:M91 family zinc metallopeptidase [uncultured Treponema sp.]
MDPDGRDIDVSGLCTSDLIKYANAKKELRQTERGRELLSNLENSTNKYKISLNSRSKNNYDPATKTVNWDPNRRLGCTDGKELSPSVLLAHELGHAEQDMISPLPINPTYEERLQIENENVKNTENPIAATLNSAIRKNYNDVVYASEKNKICGYDLSKIPRGPLTKTQTEMVDKIKFHIAQENMLQDNGVK